MRLIRLSANKTSFHTIIFKEKGLNIIRAMREHPEIIDRKKTYNGVGKTLLLQLIHFCLGSSKISEFETKLKGWEFRLEFKIGDEKYWVARSTEDQSKVLLNNETTTVTEYRKILGEKVFNLREPIKHLSFRSLITRFLRLRKDSYSYYDSYVADEKPFTNLLNNTYLLGLDIERVIKKHNLRNKYEEVHRRKEQIEKDETFKEYFMGSREVDISIIDLEEKLKTLSFKLLSFKVAENYHEIQRKADDLSLSIKRIENKSVIFKRAVSNIEKSLALKPDVPNEKIIQLYEDASINLDHMIKKRLNDVVAFHSKLISNRTKRLLEEKNRWQRQLKGMEEERALLERELDRLMEYLGSHGALDKFVALNKQFGDYSRQLDKIKTYRDLIQKYQNRLSEIKIDLQTENIDTNKYLAQAKSVIEDNMKIFRGLSKEFYEDKPGGINIKNNEKENNEIRFNIDVHIQDDMSDGINEVKIFCFDFTILKAQHNHKVKYIFHDSRLFGNMDPRQRATLFEQAYNNAIESDLQYICTANEDTLNSFRDVYDEDRYREIIENNIVAELTDESDKTKLLGIQVDMVYE